MDKRGNSSFIVVVFLLVLFMLFFVLKLNGSTGYAVVNSDSNLVLNDLTLNKTEIITEGFNVFNAETGFHKNNLIGCIFDYTLKDKNNLTNFSIGFYSQDKTIDNPNGIYYDIFNIKSDNVFYSNDSGIAIFNATEYKPGDWHCFAIWEGNSLLSNKLTMNDSAPVLINPIPSINIDVNGNYIDSNQTLDLNNYFKDPEGDKITFGAVGYSNIVVSVDSDGIVSFSNPNKWEGYENVLFRAYDGYLGTFSNNLTIKVGSGVSSTFGNDCTPVWDCNWDTCVNGKQNCVYYDKSNCNVITSKPADLIRDCSTDQQAQTAAQAPKVVVGDLKSFNVNIPSTSDTTRNFLVIGIVVLILFILGFGTYFILSLRKKPVAEVKKVETNNFNPVAKLQVNAENINELKSYISKALKQGQQESKIVKDLLSAGWKKEDIDKTLNFFKLKSFVDTKLAAGFDKDKIVESLKAKGWKDDVINSLFEK